MEEENKEMRIQRRSGPSQRGLRGVANEWSKAGVPNRQQSSCCEADPGDEDDDQRYGVWTGCQGYNSNDCFGCEGYRIVSHRHLETNRE